jgi:hypothetical protein
MIKLKPIEESLIISLGDVRALDVLVSGMQDSPENKAATKTYSLYIAKCLQGVVTRLEKEAEKI